MSRHLHLGWSSHVYPLEAGDLAATPDYDGAVIPPADLPDNAVILYLRPGAPDTLLRGREIVRRARPDEAVPVRVVFKPSVAKWNLPATLVRVLRDRHRYHGTGVYHISARAVRAMGLERAIRTLDNPQQRAHKDRARSMQRLADSLRRNGYDDARPINVRICRICGVTDSLRQGHHRVSACLELGVDRMAVEFTAAGALPRALHRPSREGLTAYPRPEAEAVADGTTRPPELQLLVVWPKGRKAERRILRDVEQRFDVVAVRSLRFEGDAEEAYRRFYGPALPDARRKVQTCGKGDFLLVVVRDRQPRYGERQWFGKRTLANLNLLEAKTRYRRWAGGGHRVHGTLTAAEFDRDVRMLTGHSADEWARGVPGELAPELPEGWTALSATGPFASAPAMPGPRPELADARVFLEDKYINDRFLEGRLAGVPCVAKHSRKAPWSIGNEYRLAARMHAAAPQVVPRPLGWHLEGDGKGAEVYFEKVAGPSLAALLDAGLAPADADRYAADILALADALKAADVLHRDLFADNLLLGADGHLKAIDWQLAIRRDAYREDPWVERNWKFRYVVFGVNRELGLGVWNDFHALGKVLDLFPRTEAVRAARARLSEEAPAQTFSAPPRGRDRVRLWLYGCSLRLQMLLRGRRHRKYAQLERRWRTVRCKWD